MHHRLGATHHTFQRGVIGEVVGEYRLNRRRQSGAGAGVPQQAAHRVAAGDQRRHQMGADETGAAGNRYAHHLPPPRRRVWESGLGRRYGGGRPVR